MPELNPNKIKTIDLFAGCGGLTEGFEMSSKFSTVAAIEWDKASLNTLINRLKTKWGVTDKNFAPLLFDMQRTEELLYGWNNDAKYGTHKGLVKSVSEEIGVIVGGPPCQAYSIAGRIRDANGMKNDYRNYLFETYITIVNKFRPKVFIFENVAGMLSSSPDGTPIPEIIRQGFKNIGYEIIEDLKKNALLDAVDYGVPQYRKRLIILGMDKNVFGNNVHEYLLDFYKNILPKHKVKQHRTVGEMILNLPKFKLNNNKDSKVSHVDVGTNDIPNHKPRYHNKRDIEIFRDLTLDLKEGTNKYNSIDSIKELYKQRTGKSSNIHKYNVLNPTEPSNAIVAHLHKDGLRHIHPDPEQMRTITVREAARLQTFPDDFEFLGTQGDQYKMVGNAVPPVLAKIIAESVYTLLEKYYYQKRTVSTILSTYDNETVAVRKSSLRS